MKHVLAFAVAVAFVTAVQAAPETYVIDNAHTFPRFEYSIFGRLSRENKFDKTSGSITLDREAGNGKIEIKVEAGSVNTGNPVLNKIIRSREFFNTEKYPEISYISNDLQFDGDKLIAVHGKLTIKDITRQVMLKITDFYCFSQEAPKMNICGAIAVGTVKRSDFNMGKYAPQISDEMTLRIIVEAENRIEPEPRP